MASRSIVFLVGVCIAIIAWCLVDNFDPRILKGKKVVITGASSGIGEQLAYQYSMYGASVTLIARREKELKRVVSKCNDLGAKQAHYILADLSSLEAAKKVHAMVQDIDILVLNHLKPGGGSLTSESDLTKVPGFFEVNTFSYINLATLFLPGLQRTNGSIIVVSSVTGIMGMMRESCYSSNKHALHGFFNSLRQDLSLAGHTQLSITMCVIGPIDTASKLYFKNHQHVYWYPVDECAFAIVKGGALRQRQMYYPYFTKVLQVAHFFLPEFIETFVHVKSGELTVNEAVVRYFRLK